jgi:RNA-directed DNA polymerase
VSTNLTRIGDKARAHPDLVLTSLYHHIADIDHLRVCYRVLKGNKAVGVNEVTKAKDAEDLETNLQDLSARLTRMGYRPQPKRRTGRVVDLHFLGLNLKAKFIAIDEQTEHNVMPLD